MKKIIFLFFMILCVFSTAFAADNKPAATKVKKLTDDQRNCIYSKLSKFRKFGLENLTRSQQIEVESCLSDSQKEILYESRTKQKLGNNQCTFCEDFTGGWMDCGQLDSGLFPVCMSCPSSEC